MFNFSKPKINVDEKEIDDVINRGVENVFPNREFLKSKMMKGERLSIYLGIDPTGPTLHLGHVIPLLKLSKFQKLGHQIVLLMGDFTGMVGDPTDKTTARRKLTREKVLENLKEYQKQASKFISFSGPNKALFKFNSKWLAGMDFSEVLELTSLVTVDQMLKRDMFVRREEEGKPVYVHELLYPIMQGYDSVAMDVDGEIGGNDQTFNMLVGRDLMKLLKNKEKFVIATKLLVDSSGKKMGKTEDNMVALNQTPEDMFGKVMSWSDDLILTGFEVLTDISLADIASMKELMGSGKNPRDFKAHLAREIVALYHGEKKAKMAEENFENTFTKGGIPEDIVDVSVAKDVLFVDILMVNELVVSKSDFRRLVSEGAITNMDTGEKITDPNMVVYSGVFKIGKRRFIKINVL